MHRVCELQVLLFAYKVYILVDNYIINKLLRFLNTSNCKNISFYIPYLIAKGFIVQRYKNHDVRIGIVFV